MPDLVYPVYTGLGLSALVPNISETFGPKSLLSKAAAWPKQPLENFHFRHTVSGQQAGEPAEQSCLLQLEAAWGTC